ncbi:MAG: hypothetical protein JSW34_10365 [Candidatus Zixiibacteriota bacterium]|nr:MAG: hypothetical protein JSW34_10365 [candidate division Zixibacteria bacterium]
MSEQRRKILQMLAEGKIDADEAERLLAALGSGTATEDAGASSDIVRKPKFLHILVQDGRDNVDIKVPIMLVKAGMKLGTLVPEKARAKLTGRLGMHGLDLDLNQLDSEKIDILLKALAESSIDIDSNNEKVRIYCA